MWKCFWLFYSTKTAHQYGIFASKIGYGHHSTSKQYIQLDYHANKEEKKAPGGNSRDNV